MASTVTQQPIAINRPYLASTPLPQQRPPLVVQSLNQNQTANVVQILRTGAGITRTALPTAVRVVTVTQGRPIGTSAVVRGNLVAAPASNVARVGLNGSPTRPNSAPRLILSSSPYNVGNAERVVTVPTYTVNGTLLSNVPVQIVNPTTGPFIPLPRLMQPSNDSTVSVSDISEQSAKRKRGRPRKYPLMLDADGNSITPKRQPRQKKPRSEYPPFERMILRPRGADGRVRRKSIMVPAAKRIEYVKRRRTRLLSRRVMQIITEPIQPTILRRRDYNKPNKTESRFDFSDITASNTTEDARNRTVDSNATMNGNESTIPTNADDTPRSSILRRYTYIKDPHAQQYRSVNNPEAIRTRVFMRSRSQRYSRILHNAEVMRRKSILQQRQDEDDELDKQYAEEQEKLLRQQEEEQQELERQQQHEDQKRQQRLQQQYRFVQQPRHNQGDEQQQLPSTPQSSSNRRGRKKGSKNRTRKSYVSNELGTGTGTGMGTSATPSTSRSSTNQSNAINQVQTGSADLRTLSQANGTSRSLALNAALEVRINLMDLHTLNQIFEDSTDQMSGEPNNLSVISEDTETEMTNELTTTDHDSAVEDTDDSTRKSKRSRKRPKILDL